jgi:hypothetical protein
MEEGGFELYHEKRNKFCVVYVTSLHENTLRENCGYLALLPSSEPINMLYPRYSTFGMDIYMIETDATDEYDVVEVPPPMKLCSREIIDLTLDDSDHETVRMGVKPTRLLYDSESNQNEQQKLSSQHIAEVKAPEIKLGVSSTHDLSGSPFANPRKRVRDKSPRNAPQNLLLLKRIYRNICPPSEYKPLYPDGRGKIDEPLLVYKDT